MKKSSDVKFMTKFKNLYLSNNVHLLGFTVYQLFYI